MGKRKCFSCKLVAQSFVVFCNKSYIWFQATLNSIRSVVFLVLDKNQKTRDLEDTLQKNSAKDSTVDTEVAYLTHEGMFISDAFGEGDVASVTADTTSQRNTSPNSEPCSSDSVSEPECTTDSSSSKEQTSSSVTPGGVEMMWVKCAARLHFATCQKQGVRCRWLFLTIQYKNYFGRMCFST